MATGFGTDAWLGFAEESTYGTYVPATKFLEITEESFEFERPTIQRPTLRSASNNSVVVGKTSVTGSFKCQLNYSGFDRLFKHVMGATPVTTGSGPYTHQHALANSLPTGLSFHLNRSAASVGTGSAFKLMGCQIQSMTISQSVEEEAMVEFNVIGQDFGNLNVETPTFPTLELAQWTHFAMSLGGSYDDYIKVRSYEMTIDNKLADDRYNLGSGLRVGLGRNGPRSVSIKCVTEFDSIELFTIFKNQTIATGFAVDAVWNNGASGADNRQIQLLSNAYIDSVSLPVKDAGVILADVAFTCIGNNDEFYITTINSISSI